jgi:hypothetical protein
VQQDVAHREVLSKSFERVRRVARQSASIVKRRVFQSGNGLEKQRKSRETNEKSFIINKAE